MGIATGPEGLCGSFQVVWNPSESGPGVGLPRCAKGRLAYFTQFFLNKASSKGCPGRHRFRSCSRYRSRKTLLMAFTGNRYLLLCFWAEPARLSAKSPRTFQCGGFALLVGVAGLPSVILSAANSDCISSARLMSLDF